jgi:NADH dehydrogenase/putative oxidoreductase
MRVIDNSRETTRHAGLTASAAPDHPVVHLVVNVVAFAAATFRLLEGYVGALTDLAIRLCLALTFLVSAAVKLADWNKALYLSANEYPVTWLNAVTAAYLGVSIEFVGALLLAFGVATQFAAVALLALVVVIQLNYMTLDLNLLQAALLAWFVVHGAGALSLDRIFSRGLAESALPLAARILSLLGWVTRVGAPIYELSIRAWIAGAIIVAAIATGPSGDVRLWLPVASARDFVSGPTVALAVLIAIGSGTRLAALALIVASAVLRMVGSGDQHYTSWLFLFLLLATNGGGALSVDSVIERLLRKRFPQLEGKPAFELCGSPRVVIVGAGFAGIACAARLSRARVSVTLIDRHNYHLFQPLLYQVATAGLSPGDIASPVRGLFRDHFNVRVLLGEVVGIDTRERKVLLGDQQISYDYLVLATGAAHSYFGRDEWAPFAPGLKRVEDATEVRRRLLMAFERAEATDDVAERQRLLTFLIVGGGPTGVELAGAIAELARWGMEKDFRRFDPAQARIVLVQAGPRLLPTFPEELSRTSRTSLERLGVEVLVDSRVEAIDDEGARVSGRRIAARTVLWAAGVVASPAAKWLAADADSAGRVKVDARLSVSGLPDVFVVGDTAASNAWNGNPVPGLAPAAKQAGAYVAKVIAARVEGRDDPTPFVYRHLGSLATIGRKAAVVDFGWIKLRGALAWWFWGAVHVGFLVDLRSRFSVMFDWFWAYLTYRSGTRLITGGSASISRSASVSQVSTPIVVTGTSPHARLTNPV